MILGSCHPSRLASRRASHLMGITLVTSADVLRCVTGGLTRPPGPCYCLKPQQKKQRKTRKKKRKALSTAGHRCRPKASKGLARLAIVDTETTKRLISITKSQQNLNLFFFFCFLFISLPPREPFSSSHSRTQSLMSPGVLTEPDPHSSPDN